MSFNRILYDRDLISLFHFAFRKYNDTRCPKKNHGRYFRYCFWRGDILDVCWLVHFYSKMDHERYGNLKGQNQENKAVTILFVAYPVQVLSVSCRPISSFLEKEIDWKWPARSPDLTVLNNFLRCFEITIFS